MVVMRTAEDLQVNYLDACFTKQWKTTKYRHKSNVSNYKHPVVHIRGYMVLDGTHISISISNFIYIGAAVIDRGVMMCGVNPGLA